MRTWNEGGKGFDPVVARAIAAAALMAALVMGLGCSESNRAEPTVKAALTGGLAHEGPRIPTGPLGPRDVVLDARWADGAWSRMVGTLAEVPEAADPPMRMTVRIERGDAPGSDVAVGDVSYARWTPDGGRIVVDTDRTLWIEAAGTDARARIDGQVEGGVSVSRNGRFIAYARGDVPELTIARVDLAGDRQPVAVAPEALPAWGPGVADDGTVVFVAAHSGLPAWYRAEVGGEAEQLTGVGRDPSSDDALRREPIANGLGATLVEAGPGGTLDVWFEFDRRVHRMRAPSGEIRELGDLRWPVRGREAGEIGAWGPGGFSMIGPSGTAPSAPTQRQEP